MKEDIDALTYKERAKMVQEAEDFVSDERKIADKASFPKYFVIREKEPADGSKVKDEEWSHYLNGSPFSGSPNISIKYRI